MATPDNKYSLAGNAVDAYEAQKVASIFRPLANVTLDHVNIMDGDIILDVACGTGIIARAIRERFGPGIPTIGIDINEMMIEKARAICGALDGKFDWHVSSVTAMPVEPNFASKCFCQQGMQYFPDRLDSLREMHRVLRDAGLLIITVWEQPNDYFLAQSEAITRHVDAATGKKALAPFSFRAEKILPDLLQSAGFVDTQVKRISIDRVIPDAVRGIRQDIEGSPLGPPVGQRGPAVMDAIVKDIISACSSYMRATDLVIPQHAHLLTARAQKTHALK